MLGSGRVRRGDVWCAKLRHGTLKMQLDAVIVNYADHWNLYQDLADGTSAIEPSLWARLIASFLKKKEFSVEILDAVALRMSADETIVAIGDANPRLIILLAFGHQPSASTQVMDAVIKLSRGITENLAAPAIIVGGHPSSLPQRTLRESGSMFVATGEGLETCAALIEGATRNGNYDDWLHSVPGLCYWYDGAPRVNSPARNAWNLDEEIPGGMWDLLPSLDKYRAHNWHCLQEPSRVPYASVASSLGCPYSCEFCCIQIPFREGDRLKFGSKSANSYRMWSPQRFADEIEFLVKERGVTNIKIIDEMYVLNRAHVVGIADELIKRGLGRLVNFWCYARVDTLRDDELMAKMREGGVKWCCVGIESMSEHVRDGIDKNDYTIADIFKACEKLRAHDINLIGNFLLGLPDDNEDSIQQTCRMAKEIMPEWFNVYSVVAYPGTKLYDYAVGNGWELPPRWGAYAHHAYDYQPLPTKYLTARRVLELRDKAFRDFYSDPSYLEYITRKFGTTARREVEKINSIKLKRKLLGD